MTSLCPVTESIFSHIGSSSLPLPQTPPAENKKNPPVECVDTHIIRIYPQSCAVTHEPSFRVKGERWEFLSQVSLIKGALGEGGPPCDLWRLQGHR